MRWGNPFLPLHFNSHTREGVTGNYTTAECDVCDFNSHTREGVTVISGEP